LGTGAVVAVVSAAVLAGWFEPGSAPGAPSDAAGDERATVIPVPVYTPGAPNVPERR
jgi:hypothetical protein